MKRDSSWKRNNTLSELREDSRYFSQRDIRDITEKLRDGKFEVIEVTRVDPERGEAEVSVDSRSLIGRKLMVTWSSSAGWDWPGNLYFNVFRTDIPKNDRLYNELSASHIRFWYDDRTYDSDEVKAEDNVRRSIRNYIENNLR